MATQRSRRTETRPPPGAEVGGGLRAARARLRKEQILAVALERFAAQGFAATTTKQIASAAGVAEGLLFHHFGNKEAILIELASRRGTFAGRVLGLVERGADASAQALFAAVAQAYAGVSADERTFITFASAEAHVNPVLRSHVTAGNALIAERLASVLRTHVRRGELRADADLSATVWGFFGGFQFFFAQHRDLSDAAWRARAGAFATGWADQCWRGIASDRSLSAHSRKDRSR